MQNATVPLGTPINSIIVPPGAAQYIDNENIAVGLVRKVRRIIFTNLDNAQRTIRLCSCVAGVGVCQAAHARVQCGKEGSQHIALRRNISEKRIVDERHYA